MIEKGFNGLSAKEWTLMGKNVISSAEVSSSREKKHVEHGATFPVKLAERLIKTYSSPGDLVLDPFAGVGTVLDACVNTGRRGIGFELYDRFYAYCKEIADASPETMKCWAMNGDCRIMIDLCDPDTLQLVVTSPPYANHMRKSKEDREKTHKNSIMVEKNNSQAKPYGDDDRDFGNLDYGKYLVELDALMKRLYTVTRPGGYNVWIVKDLRDTKNDRPYISLHSDIALLGERAGFLHHDLIVWDQNAQRSLVALGYPSAFYSNQNCSFIVVLRKKPIKNK